LPIYPWEGYHAVYSLPIYLVGVIRRRLICLSALYGDIGRLDLSNKLLCGSRYRLGRKLKAICGCLALSEIPLSTH